MSATIIWPIIAVMITILLAVFSYLIVLTREVSKVAADSCRVQQDHQEKLNRIPEIEHKLDTSIAREEVYFKVLDKWIADTIHSPHTPERDALMDKFTDRTLTCSEAKRLLVLLQEGMDETTDPDKKIVFSMGIASVNAYLVRLKSNLKWSKIHGLAGHT